jgi:signal transduction histidine kinase
MLFLQHAADGSESDTPAKVPVSAAAASYLERALIAADPSIRLVELEQALACDPSLASWALRTVELRSGQTVNRIDEAARWLSRHLVTELATALGENIATSPQDSVEWRLPALVKTLSEYQDRQANFERRVEREKLDAMKELAYGASHEINNPLANIAARAQTLLDGEDDPERRQKLVAIHRQAMRAHEMISDLMLFARPPKVHPTSFNLHELLRQVVDGLTPLAQESHVRLELDEGRSSTEITADETQLGVAVHAVVKNAIEATGDDGCVTVTLHAIEDNSQPRAEILVRDDGPGISDEVGRHIFDPFFSGREAGRGLGFGLSKCWRIITDQGGEVVVNSPAGGGAQISILLPISVEPQSSVGQAWPDRHTSGQA